LGYQNIEVRVGDGTQGWPEASPFDAILVAASGPEVPCALKHQLAIGRRLILPVGDYRGGQTMCQITRKNETDFEEQSLGPVSFVPLVGK
jgi:protein-L-isoaspartate(D-aspartate) O-methyltransferase